jgi:competence protein ComEA
VSSHRSDDPLAALRRWELNGTAVRALAVVAVLVAIGAGIFAWGSRPEVQPVAPAVSSSSSHSPSTVESPAELVVAVGGRVAHPGLVRLPPGARVADALAAAGGALPDTDLSTLNLARKVVDGELIVVGAPQPAGAPGAPGGLVNLYTATNEQLQTLPGVGPVLAERIIAYREQHGGFASVADLRHVTGIGDSRFEELKDLVTV